MNNKLIVGLILAYLVGFATSYLLNRQKQETKTTKENVALNTFQDTEKTNLSTIEDFNDFFYKFRNDSVFQLNRVKFPLKFEGLSDDYTKEEIADIKKSDWHFHQFFSNEEYYVEISRTTTVKEPETGTRLVSFNGIENGIYVSYEFKLIDTKWVLIKWIDRST